MITRLLSSAGAGVAITSGLLFLMQLLIASGEEIIVEPRHRFEVPWIRLETEEPLIVDPPVYQRPKPPPVPPMNSAPAPDGDVGGTISIPGPPPPGGDATAVLTGLRFGDGPLVSIIKVKPQYPVAAASRGLEGTVLVQYDVTAMGTVENVVVLESSNSVFNKAAIAAASRFKYKPSIVDGRPIASKGLRNLFRFEMEE